MKELGYQCKTLCGASVHLLQRTLRKWQGSSWVPLQVKLNNFKQLKCCKSILKCITYNSLHGEILSFLRCCVSFFVLWAILREGFKSNAVFFGFKEICTLLSPPRLLELDPDENDGDEDEKFPGAKQVLLISLNDHECKTKLC